MDTEPAHRAESVAIPVTFSCTAKGYESRVTVDGAEPQRAGELIAEWLNFQQHYLGSLVPGDTVTVVKGKRTNGK
jgi:hypothetical protein